MRGFCLVVVILALVPTLYVSAQEPATPAAAYEEVTPEQATQYPLTIENCGMEITFDSAPERVVTLATNTTEMMLALDLGDRLAGMVGPKSDILPELQTAVEPVDVISESAFPYPSREVILAAEPTLLLSGYGGDFSEGAYGTREAFADLGIQTLSLTDACDGGDDATLETTFDDILMLGRIFNVPDRAAELVNRMQADAAAASPANPPVTVFVFAGDAVEETVTVGGAGLLNDMITRAGGRNIFADVPSGSHNVSVNMEEIVARDPDVILIVQYRALDPDDIIAYMRSDPSWSKVAAVRNDRFVTIDVTSTVPGVRNGTALARLSEGFSAGA